MSITMDDAKMAIHEMAALVAAATRERDQAIERARSAEQRVVDLEIEVTKLRERISVLRGVSL